MNYYKRHLGDYAKDTRHLSLLEHGAFCLLLDYYYSTEKPIPDDRCERIANAYETHERNAVRSVLEAFFTLTDEGWRNGRADEEIAAFHGKSLKAKESAEKRWSERNANAYANAYANASKTQCDGNASHKPLAISQKEQKKGRACAPACPDDVSPQTWADWLALRKAKRAPVTETVLEGARKEAAKAGMALGDFLAVWCRRGSQGLEADWLKPSECTARAGPVPGQSKTLTAIQTLQAMKHGNLDSPRDPRRPEQASLPVAGTLPRR